MGLFDRFFGNSNKSKPIAPEFRFDLEVVPGKTALKELDKLITKGKEQGFSPVIVGGEDEFAYFNDQFDINEEPLEEILLAAKTVDVKDFFKQRINEDSDYYSVEAANPEPDSSPKGGLTAHFNRLGRSPLKWVFIAKIPDRVNCNIPAHLSYGNWNECPSPEEHVAIWKYWNEKYGAEIVCVTHDIIEAKVSNPPMTYEEALLLAKEQFIYCADIVHQGVESLENLAALLQNGSTWYFWWD